MMKRAIPILSGHPHLAHCLRLGGSWLGRWSRISTELERGCVLGDCELCWKTRRWERGEAQPEWATCWLQNLRLPYFGRRSPVWRRWQVNQKPRVLLVPSHLACTSCWERRTWEWLLLPFPSPFCLSSSTCHFTASVSRSKACVHYIWLVATKVKMPSLQMLHPPPPIC